MTKGQGSFHESRHWVNHSSPRWKEVLEGGYGRHMGVMNALGVNKESPRTTQRKFVFTQRTITLCDSLPQDVQLAKKREWAQKVMRKHHGRKGREGLSNPGVWLQPPAQEVPREQELQQNGSVCWRKPRPVCPLPRIFPPVAPFVAMSERRPQVSTNQGGPLCACGA